jgi:hypothetical protein
MVPKSWITLAVSALVGAIVFVWYEQYQSGKYQRITLAGRATRGTSA